MQKQPELVGGCLGAGGPIGSKVRLPRLDVVLCVAASAIDVFIKHTSVSGRQARDDEAGVCPVGTGLDASDDPLDPAPARSAVVKLREAAYVACLRGGGVARHHEQASGGAPDVKQARSRWRLPGTSGGRSSWLWPWAR